MVKVPLYEQQVSARPIFQQTLNANATPEAFGADIGRGMQGLAKGVEQASTALAQVQELENVARAKDADNAYAGWMRERMYGEGGFMTLSGRNAVDGRMAFEKEADAKRREFGADLTGSAAQAYSDASTARLNQTLQTSIVHTANERKQWFSDSSSARLNTFSEDAVAAFNNPAKVNMNIAAGQAEIRQQGAMLGWDADTLKNREAEFVSEVRLNTALRTMAADPVAAKKYYDEHKDQLTGPHQFKFEEALKVPLAAENVKRYTADFFTQQREPNTSATQGTVPSATMGASGPTQARGFLIGKLVAGHGQSHVDGLDQSFATNLAAMLQDAPPEIREGLGILSGARSVERQAELWAAALAKYGSEAEARKWVAPPGRSNHNHGTAADLAYNGRSLAHAPANVVEWVHANAGKYGMHFPLGNENWHVEPLGTRGTAAGSTVAQSGGGVSARALTPSATQVEAFLNTIKDPAERDLTRKSIAAQLELATKAQKAQNEEYTTQAFNLIETQNISPFQLPSTITSAIGMEGMSSLMTYWEKRQSGQAIKTDPVIMSDLQMAYARNPTEFAARDLFAYKNVLSNEDWKRANEWKQTALTDERKAREEGLTLTTAFSQASTQLDAVGITTTGKEGDDRKKAAEQIARFQAALTAEMEAFKQQTQKAPTQTDIQSMVNRLLLPVVIKEQSWSVNPFSGFSGTSDRETFLFDAEKVGSLGNGATSELNFKYKDIPVTDRVTIEAHLKSELGRQPSEDQVIAVYEQFMLERNKVPTR